MIIYHLSYASQHFPTLFTLLSDISTVLQFLIKAKLFRTSLKNYYLFKLVCRNNFAVYFISKESGGFCSFFVHFRIKSKIEKPLQISTTKLLQKKIINIFCNNNLCQKYSFKLHLKSFDFMKICDPFWEIQSI